MTKDTERALEKCMTEEELKQRIIEISGKMRDVLEEYMSDHGTHTEEGWSQWFVLSVSLDPMYESPMDEYVRGSVYEFKLEDDKVDHATLVKHYGEWKSEKKEEENSERF